MHKLMVYLTGFAWIPVIIAPQIGRCLVVDYVENVVSEFSQFYAWCKGKFANCTFLNEDTEVPQNLPTDIKVMVLLNCFNIKFEIESFTKYSELVCLFTSGMRHSEEAKISYDVATFFSLKKLELMAVLRSDFWHENLEFPDTVKYLLLYEIKMNGVDLSYLKELTFLQISNCGLEDAPEINDLAPLTSLALTDPFHQLSAERLADYCLLNSLNLTMVPTSHDVSRSFCRCARLKSWISSRVKDGSLPYFNGEVKCPAGHEDSECNFNFTDAVAKRENCLRIHQAHTTVSPSATPSSIDEWKLIGIVVFGFVLISLISVVVAHFIWKRLTAETEEDTVKDTVEGAFEAEEAFTEEEILWKVEN